MSTESLNMETTAFDAMAADYDATFTQTRLGEWLRGVVWSHLHRALPAAGRILEIGCGTGEDAVLLAQRGYEVCATDASGRMLELARDKAHRLGCQSRIDFRQVAMEKLGQELEGQSFDAVFSNFGALNCAEDISRLMREIAGVSRHGAPVILVIMGRYVPWEWIWYLARLKWHKALRRVSRDGTLWRGMRIRYPTTRSIRLSLAPYYDAINFSPLGFVLPPSYASAWLEHNARAFRLVSQIEQAVHRYAALADFADHYVVDARRNSSPAHA